MLRIVFIIGGVVALVFFGLRGFNKIVHPQEYEEKKVSAAVPLPPPLKDVGTPVPVEAMAIPEKKNPPVYVESVAVYTFKNRPVPPAPFGRNQSTIGTGADSNGLQLSIDTGSNSWILRGPPNEVEQTQRIAALVDVVQTELDLDFLLIAVSEDWLRSFGFQAAYQRGANWLPSFSLDGTGGTLRLESGSFAVDISAQRADSMARLVSAPVVRCITGEPWQFSADKQVPIAATQRSEGVVTTGYEYREIGLGFEGTIQKAGPQGSFRLTVVQRNGDTDGTGQGEQTVPPTLRSQILRSSLVVEIGRWSCIGGVSSWRIEQKKRILGMSEKEAQELLLVFVRPRDSLELAPKAFPVGDRPEHLTDWGQEPWELDNESHPLLPPPDWEKDETEFIHNRKRSK